MITNFCRSCAEKWQSEWFWHFFNDIVVTLTCFIKWAIRFQHGWNKFVADIKEYSFISLGYTADIKMSFLPSGNIFRELQVVHDTGYFSAQPSLDDQWQQVNSSFKYFVEFWAKATFKWYFFEHAIYTRCKRSFRKRNSLPAGN